MTYTIDTTQLMLDHIDSYNGDWDNQATSHIHNLSLEVAELFNEAYHEGASDDMSALMGVFRTLRRELPIGDDGKRYGATEAWEFMQRGDTNNYIKGDLSRG